MIILLGIHRVFNNVVSSIHLRRAAKHLYSRNQNRDNSNPSDFQSKKVQFDFTHHLLRQEPNLNDCHDSRVNIKIHR